MKEVYLIKSNPATDDELLQLSSHNVLSYVSGERLFRNKGFDIAVVSNEKISEVCYVVFNNEIVKYNEVSIEKHGRNFGKKIIACSNKSIAVSLGIYALPSSTINRMIEYYNENEDHKRLLNYFKQNLESDLEPINQLPEATKEECEAEKTRALVENFSQPYKLPTPTSNVDYTLNKKVFLAKDAPNSMSACHIRIKRQFTEQYQLRLSDCNNTVKIWGDLHTRNDILVGIEKMENLIELASELKNELHKRLNKVID